jgi:hypothetical protein
VSRSATSHYDNNRHSGTIELSSNSSSSGLLHQIDMPAAQHFTTIAPVQAACLRQTMRTHSNGSKHRACSTCASGSCPGHPTPTDCPLHCWHTALIKSPIHLANTINVSKTAFHLCG